MTFNPESYQKFDHFLVKEVAPYVINLQINRPRKGNSFNRTTWLQYKEVLLRLNNDKDNVKVIILSGNGKNFSTGLDLAFANKHSQILSVKIKGDIQLKEKLLIEFIKEFQDSIGIASKIDIPIIAVCHGVTIGLAFDIIGCTVIQLYSKDCKLAIPEIKMGFAADIGALQRFSHLVANKSLFNELIFTGRIFDVKVAKKLGLTDKIFENKEETFNYALELATNIAKFNLDGIVGTKKSISLMAEGASVEQGLQFITNYNAKTLPVISNKPKL